MTVTTTLPGIYFHTESRSPISDLPRMDVAGFVGFARNGPLHIPVVIEDIVQFRDIFGGDLPLAWDDHRHQMQYSFLGATVESFFKNGGRRCWVVRVAADGTNSSTATPAQSQHFVLPGVVQVSEIEQLPVEVIARSPGSWADKLKVGTQLVVSTLAPHWLQDVGSPASGRLFNADEGDYLLTVRSVPADLQTNDLVELRFGTELRVYLFIDRINRVELGRQLHASVAFWFAASLSSPDILSPSEVTTYTPLDEQDGLDAYALIELQSPAIVPTIRRLRFNILVWQGDNLQGQLTNLAFHPDHPRFWGNMPTDETLFGDLLMTASVNLDTGMQQFINDVMNPRFPLAAGSQFGTNTTSLFLPLNMNSFVDAAEAQTAQDDITVSELVRNGLDVFSADLFLDKELAGLTTNTVLQEAEHKRFVAGQSLKGLYSLLAIDEVSIISVPDSVHRHWDTNPPSFQAGITAPVLDALSTVDEFGRRTLQWSFVSGVRRYVIQQSLSADFDEFIQYVIDKATSFQLEQDQALSDEPDTTLKLLINAECPKTYFFRVRAEGYGRVSAWSNTRAAYLPETHFYSCERPDASLLGLVINKTTPESPADQIQLDWQAEDVDSLADTLADRYQLQRATDADFVSALTLYQGSEQQQMVSIQPDTLVFYRVRAWHGDINGPWSNTIVIPPNSLSTQTLNHTDSYDDQDLLAMQYALIRYCAAKADTVALLSLPSHYQQADINQHLDAFTPNENNNRQVSAIVGSGNIRVQSLNQSEGGALSYAALYHPWIRVASNREINRDDNDAYRLIPAVGAVCGSMAITAATRGAWISSANKPLKDVLGVSPRFNQEQLISLNAKQLNLVREIPNTFVLTNADTLSQDNEFKPMSVRRLMILLRRLVLREGIAYVFEPNSVDFRHSVQHYWESLLSGLYQRGALLGDRDDQAFRVITDDSVNDQRTRDLGRFVVELRIAPSRPLKFINVRLLQSGPEQLMIQELL